jgi:hypothetical protein
LPQTIEASGRFPLRQEVAETTESNVPNACR